jgi:rSAM/selenodomain-associated transferase 2
MESVHKDSVKTDRRQKDTIKGQIVSTNGQTGQAVNGYTFSIIIPVLNEQERINTFIEHIAYRCLNHPCEIIVVDGDPNGSTINTIRSKNVITTISKCGRAIQMNAGAQLATGPIIVFLHVDTQLPSGAFEHIEQVLQNKKYVAGAFGLDIDSENLLVKFIAAGARIRSRLTRIPYGDQAIFMRKDYFERIGRFKEIPLMEDVELMRRIKGRGDKICLSSERVLTSARRWEKEGVFYTSLRNLVILGLYYLGARPSKLVKYYRRHQ